MCYFQDFGGDDFFLKVAVATTNGGNTVEAAKLFGVEIAAPVRPAAAVAVDAIVDALTFFVDC
jgi:hypothetical protein